MMRDNYDLVEYYIVLNASIKPHNIDKIQLATLMEYFGISSQIKE